MIRYRKYLSCVSQEEEAKLLEDITSNLLILNRLEERSCSTSLSLYIKIIESLLLEMLIYRLRTW